MELEEIEDFGVVEKLPSPEPIQPCALRPKPKNKKRGIASSSALPVFQGKDPSTPNHHTNSQPPTSPSAKRKKFDGFHAKTYRFNHKYKDERENLPIFKARTQILESVSSHPVTIIISETGSGKSTQIPQYLAEAGLANLKSGGVVVTQPRRVACQTLAERVSQEMGCKLGYQVGYSVRFDDKSGPSTIIKYATDGMVLRELITDSMLNKYQYIILDEAHERTLRNDILLGHVKSILKNRTKPCHVIIMSATLDASRFSKFFDNAPIIRIPGRGHPVSILNSHEVQTDYLDAAVQTALQIHLISDPTEDKDFVGKDILVFLPGQEEIESCATLLNRHLTNPDLHHELANMQVFPLFAGLPAHQQAMALKPLADKKMRKCILATNIAETSLTIPGVRYIIDTGVAKYRSYRPSTGMETLQVQPISKSGAAQRAGRAGREGPGVCYRLYPSSEFAKLSDTDIPEIQRCNLDGSLLILMASGVDNVLEFEFMDRPPLLALERSLANLYALGALQPSTLKLGPMGHKMAHFPIDPKFSKVLLASHDLGCTNEVLWILAALSVDNLFYTPADKREEANEARRRFVNPYSDHLTYLAIMTEYAKEHADSAGWATTHFINNRSLKQAKDIRSQLERLCLLVKLDPQATNRNEEVILKCLLQGCFLNTALLMPNGQYRTVESNQEVRIHPSSVMANKKVEAVVFNELVETSHPYLRGVSSVQRSWVVEAAPHALAKRSL